MAHPTARLIAVALIASTALVACKKHETTTATDTTAPAATPADTMPAAPAPLPPTSTPSPAAADAISEVQLGTSVGADNRVASPMTSFGTKDTLYASITTPANTTGKLGARWTYLGTDGKATAKQVDTQSKDLTAGTSATTHEFHISKPDGWPVGKYRVEISHDGTVVQSRDFDVR
ncbi:hypothetical protein [Cognatilysobacter lacus]|uniref:Secreted protein n=1 Tax=Cognatilysobacter lacus TaxID=1643323 RepID=A0A5D8Z6T3_9GAMM|nr:hypothetical protein [Lysobacter lacus]TZF90635.1 hypothetical protein FW784_04500 [Lysobacter lacus]